MRASINQQKGVRGKRGKVSPPPAAGGGPTKMRNGKPAARGKRNSVPTAGPRGGAGSFNAGRPNVERLPHLDPDGSVLRHSGREETMGEYSESVTQRADEEEQSRQNKWSYLDADESHAEPAKKRALRRVAPTRGRTPPEFEQRDTGRNARGGSAGSRRKPQQNEELDHRGRFVSR